MEIPHTKLKPDILRGIIEEFVLREGTDYGLFSFTLEQKINEVKAQLERGEVYISFDAEQETCNIITRSAAA